MMQTRTEIHKAINQNMIAVMKLRLGSRQRPMKLTYFKEERKDVEWLSLPAL